MTNFKKTFWVGQSIVAACFLASCSQDSTETVVPQPEDNLVELNLTGGIATSVTTDATRAVVNTAYFTANDLDVLLARIDQNNTTGNYPADYSGAAALPAKRIKGTGNTAITLTTPEYYLPGDANNKTKLIGWYPAGALAGGKVTFALDGMTDVMLTNEVEGDKSVAGQFGVAGKEFNFKHLLSQVKVQAYAINDDVAGKWGAITSIQLKGQSTQCIVTLPVQTPGWGATKQPLTLKALANDGAVGNVALTDKTTDSPAECGYTLFPPTTGSTLTLTVTTEKGGARDVPVDLGASKTFAAGVAHTIKLKFTADDIQPKAGITDWTDYGTITDVPL